MVRGEARGRLACAAALLVAGALLSGCADAAVGRAATVENRLQRLDGVSDASVRAVAVGATPRIVLTADPDLDPEDLRLLLGAVEATATGEEYDDYRVELVVGDDVVVVDQGFDREEQATALLRRWERAAGILDGPVRLGVDGLVRIEVAAGADFVHDLTEAAKLPSGPRTRWEVVGEHGRYRATGRIPGRDVDAARLLDAELASAGQPVRARTWTLERLSDRTYLDVVVDLTPGLRPDQLTRAAYEERLRPLARSAVDATDRVRGRLDVRLVHRGTTGPDTFAWASTERDPLPERDPERRGWDGWLDDLLR